MATVATPIYCCSAATPVFTASSHKLHYDPNRELHETIFRSFIAYAIRQHQEAERLEKERIKTQELIRLLMIAMKEEAQPSTPNSHSSTPVSFSAGPGYGHASDLAPPQPSPPSGLASALATIQAQPPPAPVLTYESLLNNPLSDNTPYVIHLTSRHDFGPVYSHRYFVCPDDLSDDWIECSLAHWFAQGEPFKMKAEKWDLKCHEHSRFFRMTLRPNLWLRGRYSPSPVFRPSKMHTPYPAMHHMAHPVIGHGTGFAEGGWKMPLAAPSLNMEQGSYSSGESGTEDGSEVVVK